MINVADCWVRDRCKKASECNSDFCIKLFKINELCDLALLTEDQRKKKKLWLDGSGVDKDAFMFLRDIEDNITKFVSNGDNLYIYSYITGNGKTAWALRLLNSYIESVWYKSDIKCVGLFVNIPRFLISLKENINEYNQYYNDVKQSILTADIVVFDEIGAKSATMFESDHLLSIINSRLESGKSNIYTSNLGPEELRKAVGDRMYSRIINTSTQVMFRGTDKRGIR